MINYIPRRFTIIRDRELCTNCGLCVRQCSNECHFFKEENKSVLSNSNNCVACHRCVDLCPTGALRIEKYVCDYRENANWTPQYQQEICRQAESGSVLLSAMGNPKPYPIYWDKILLNASQVTNPSIDPLREPMEIRTILGRKPEMLKVEKKGKSTVEMPPQVMLETPIIFSAMSFGSISMNAQKSLAMAAKELGTLFNTGEGGLHPELADYCDCAVVQVASGRFGVHKDYLNNSKFIEIKIGQGAKPGIGGHLPGEKVNVEVSNARMIPEGSDAISPAPHHDIYSIEDLRQLIWSLKQATDGKKPVSVKIAAVHNVAAIASGCARAGADIVKREEGVDPASVVYDAIKITKEKEADILIVDTAGRLHNKKYLMDELNKIQKVIEKEMQEADKEVLLVIDGTTGQNAISQVKAFQKEANITGLVLTKLDGTAKGGAVIGIVQENKIPVKFIGIGEQIDDMEVFDSNDFVKAII